MGLGCVLYQLITDWLVWLESGLPRTDVAYLQQMPREGDHLARLAHRKLVKALNGGVNLYIMFTRYFFATRRPK